MQEYVDAILTAVKLFPLVALVITLPYIVVQYYRFGSILVLRMVFVYSFVLYILCVALLTMLPIPASETAASLQQKTPQFIPFYSIRQWFTATGFNLRDLSTWKDTLISRPAFIILANIVMMVPLGIYLRYYFEFSIGKTFVITLGFSLILELIQLTGLFGLYAVAYRMFDVDDLLMNTLGGMIGFWLAKPLMRLLPSPQQLSSLAYRKGMRVSILRQLTAALVDWLFLLGTALAVLYLDRSLREQLLALEWRWRLAAAGGVYGFAVLGYFIAAEWLCGGRTIGKWITRLRCVDSRGGRRPKLSQYLAKYAFLYFGYTSVPLVVTLLLLVVVRKYLLESSLFTLGFLLMALYGAAMIAVILFVFNRYKQLPHTALSKLRVVSTIQK